MNESLYTKTRILAPIIVGISIIIAFFFLKPMYGNYIMKDSELNQSQKILDEKISKLEKLMKLKDSLKTASGASDSIEKIRKLGKQWNSSDIIQAIMLNEFTKNKEGIPASINVSTISVNKGNKLPSGLSFGSVSVSIQSKRIEDIIEYITYITMNSSYVFTLDSISLPIDTEPEQAVSTDGYGLGLKLGVYYFE